MRISAIALALVLIAPSAALAHKTSVHRSLMLEVSDRELHVIVALRIPSGNARRALELTLDVDRDGRLTGAELRRLESVLLARALDGLALYVDGSTKAVGRPEVKTKTDPRDGPIELMVHGVVEVPAGRTALAVTTGGSGDPLELMVLPGTRAPQEPSRGTSIAGGFRASLGRGDRVDWTIQ
jgi:hypothetical protein